MDARMTPTTTRIAKDPVCGMTVDPATTPHRHSYDGVSYFFCSGGCRAKFAADPEQYLDPDAYALAAPMPAGTIFTCPMHPDVRQEGPGSCPICGMALEPMTPTAGEEAENPELRDMTSRLIVVNVTGLERRRDVLKRFMAAYRETIDWLYADPEAIPAVCFRRTAAGGLLVMNSNDRSE
jgi:YHS domain-containing protein